MVRVLRLVVLQLRVNDRGWRWRRRSVAAAETVAAGGSDGGADAVWQSRGGSNRRLRLGGRSMGEDVDGSSSSMLAPSPGEVEGDAADDDAVAPLPVAVEDDAADDDAAAPLPLPGWA